MSKRLSMIDKMVPATNHHIWDCCCDHGHLGMSLLARNAAKQVHFVDIVASITQSLEVQLTKRFAAKSEQWQVHTTDVKNIPLGQFDQQHSHLIIIAGLGGEQSLQMVQGLMAKFPNYALQFLLCPHRHHYVLRRGLAKLVLNVVAEHLLKEQKWYYEIIHLSNSVSTAQQTPPPVWDNNQIIATGSLLWQDASELHSDYLMQIMQHYRRVLRSLNTDSDQYHMTQKMLLEYQQILETVVLPQLEFGD